MVNECVPTAQQKAKWSPPQWNAYVVAGETFEVRRARLAEVPEEWRDGVLSHAKTTHQLKV